MILRSVTFDEACEFVDSHHRHHKRPRGWKFGVGAAADDQLVGVAFVGRPVSRELDDGRVIEVTRLCTDGTRNACSFLYGASARAAKALGYDRIITYILDSESGSSLKAAGWEFEAFVVGRSWSCASRPRIDHHPTCNKQRWGRRLR